MEELSPEDSLRLNVLLANKPQAIRVNESYLTVHGLTAAGEQEIKLSPNCREEQYVKRVRELISGHVLGSPGGYPVYLKRWTRMGQMRDESLEQLLLLGEPEAVIAAVCAPGLSDELARRAWWCLESADNARHMLANPEIVKGEMGPVLARYLIEHLPFETEPEVMIETVRLVLQEGLITAEEREDLWRKAGRKNAYIVGFLATVPDEMPEPANEHALLESCRTELKQLKQDNNPYGASLERVMSQSGQAFIAAVQKVLKKPANQEVVSMTLDAIRNYFQPIRPGGDPDLKMEQLVESAEAEQQSDADLSAACQALPALTDQLMAARVLSGMGYGVLRPFLRDSTAIGTLMRKKIAPATSKLDEVIKPLKG